MENKLEIQIVSYNSSRRFKLNLDEWCYGFDDTEVQLAGQKTNDPYALIHILQENLFSILQIPPKTTFRVTTHSKFLIDILPVIISVDSYSYNHLEPVERHEITDAYSMEINGFLDTDEEDDGQSSLQETSKLYVNETAWFVFEDGCLPAKAIEKDWASFYWYEKGSPTTSRECSSISRLNEFIAVEYFQLSGEYAQYQLHLIQENIPDLIQTWIHNNGVISELEITWDVKQPLDHPLEYMIKECIEYDKDRYTTGASVFIPPDKSFDYLGIGFSNDSIWNVYVDVKNPELAQLRERFGFKTYKQLSTTETIKLPETSKVAENQIRKILVKENGDIETHTFTLENQNLSYEVDGNTRFVHQTSANILDSIQEAEAHFFEVTNEPHIFNCAENLEPELAKLITCPAKTLKPKPFYFWSRMVQNYSTVFDSQNKLFRAHRIVSQVKFTEWPLAINGHIALSVSKQDCPDFIFIPKHINQRFLGNQIIEIKGVHNKLTFITELIIQNSRFVVSSSMASDNSGWVEVSEFQNDLVEIVTVALIDNYLDSLITFDLCEKPYALVTIPALTIRDDLELHESGVHISSSEVDTLHLLEMLKAKSRISLDIANALTNLETINGWNIYALIANAFYFYNDAITVNFNPNSLIKELNQFNIGVKEISEERFFAKALHPLVDVPPILESSFHELIESPNKNLEHLLKIDSLAKTTLADLNSKKTLLGMAPNENRISSAQIEKLVEADPNNESKYWSAYWDIKSSVGRAIPTADPQLLFEALEIDKAAKDAGWPESWNSRMHVPWLNAGGTIESAKAWVDKGWPLIEVMFSKLLSGYWNIPIEERLVSTEITYTYLGPTLDYSRITKSTGEFASESRTGGNFLFSDFEKRFAHLGEPSVIVSKRSFSRVEISTLAIWIDSNKTYFFESFDGEVKSVDLPLEDAVPLIRNLYPETFLLKEETSIEVLWDSSLTDPRYSELEYSDLREIFEKVIEVVFGEDWKSELTDAEKADLISEGYTHFDVFDRELWIGADWYAIFECGGFCIGDIL